MKAVRFRAGTHTYAGHLGGAAMIRAALSPMASPPPRPNRNTATALILQGFCAAVPQHIRHSSRNGSRQRNTGAELGKEEHRACREGIIARLRWAGTPDGGRSLVKMTALASTGIRLGSSLSNTGAARPNRCGPIASMRRPFVVSAFIARGGPWRGKKKTAAGLGRNRAGVPLTARALRVVTAYRHAGAKAGLGGLAAAGGGPMRARGTRRKARVGPVVSKAA